MSVHRLASAKGFLLLAVALFLVCAPVFNDTYNTLNQRVFLDLMLKGNPFTLASRAQVEFRGERWALDWPYPPITMLLDLPAWVLFTLTHAEPVYQFAFKLPLFFSAILTQWLILRLIRARESSANPSIFARAYLLNPAVILLTSVSGGFDIVAAMLILLAYYSFICQRRNWSGLVLGAAGALRLYPFLLVPVYIIALWKTEHQRIRNVLVYSGLCFAPLIFSCLPFFVTDWSALLNTLAGRQTMFGPFATVNFLGPGIYPLANWAGYTLDPQGGNILFDVLVILFLVLTIANLILVYIWIARRPASLVRANLLVLLVFFLFYPKVHGLYTIVLVPLALVRPAKIATWVWAAGAIWMLTVNGAFGATGLWYWLAPLTGNWVPAVPESQFLPLTILLAGVQALVIVAAIAETISQLMEVNEQSTKQVLVAVRMP